MVLSYKSAVLRVSCPPYPLHQHLFDATPLLEQELVLDLVAIIRVFNVF
jgi:hypothetical protein